MRTRKALAITLAVVGVVFALAYPFAVYFGMMHFGAREVGLVLLVLALPVIIRRVAKMERGQRRAVLEAPILIAVLATITAILDDIRAVLVLPVLINSALLFTFGRSLRTDKSLIEHFARLMVKDLSPAECAYCRTVTKVWCGLFVVNIVVAGTLALNAPLDWWTAYNGFIAYLLMGLLFTVEVVVRYRKFKRTGMPWLDRVFARLFPGVTRKAGPA